MNFAELVAEVITITKRPDKVADTESAVRAATLKAHQSDYYWRDLFECGLNFGSAGYIWNFDYRSLLSRWRALKYIRKYDNVTGTPGAFLATIIPEQLFDQYGSEKTDVCYGAGAFLQIKSSTAEQFFICGFYLNPDITTLTYDSWVALDHPYAIVYDAASTVFKQIGKTEEAAANKILVAEQYALIRGTNVLVEGY